MSLAGRHVVVTRPAGQAAHFAIGAERDFAAAGQRPRHGALGAHAGGGGRIIQGCNPCGHFRTRGQGFDSQRALSGGGQRILGGQHGADTVTQTEALEAGGRQNDGVELAFVELAQAGVEVAAQGSDGEIGVTRMQLGFAAQAGGADHGARRHVVETGVLR